jgi:serine/threonine-protein kinase HipA
MAGINVSAKVLYNGKLAGVLSKSGSRYLFSYDTDYLQSPGGRPVSITLPLRKAPYESDTLFPAFINMLSEGANKRMQCRMLKIDENDYFGLLLATAKDDSIGPITIEQMT